MSGFTPSELSSERGSLLREAIIDSLHPPKSTDDREAQIPSSYARTFEWAFEGQFSAWLSRSEDALDSNARLFWINGLPGSGKSTLLRFIHQNPRLRQALSAWMNPVETASFFFWESGTILQRSQEGFLRSILAQVLSKRTGLLPYVFTDLWSKLWECDTAERVRTLQEWTIEMLVAGLAKYFTLDQRPATFLLIDGLDELEGNPSVVLDLLGQISKCTRVKLCISSRPYSVFDSWFRTVASLRLQDLTAGDIERFIRGRMGAGVEDRLVEELQEKAQGVFLWASVALDILGEVDNPFDLLHTLPSALDDLYRYRLIETGRSLSELSRMLQLMRARQEVSAFTRVDDSSVMTLREMAIGLGGIDALDVEIERADGAEVSEACGVTAKVIQRASRGLLLVQKSEGPITDRMINYKHRTVKDWLATSAWNDVLALTAPFDPHLVHLNTTLTLFKQPLDKPRRARNINAWWSHLVLCFTHARYSYSDTFDLLIELDDTMSWYWIQMDKDPRLDSWARNCFGTLESRGKNPIEDPCLALAIRFGCTDFVKRYLKEGLYVPGNGKPVLEQAVAFLINRNSTLYPLSDPRLVSLLLEFGLDVNHHAATEKASRTPWEQVLDSIQQADRRKWITDETDRWTGIVLDFVAHGADLGATAHFGHKDKPEKARDLLRRLDYPGLSKLHAL